jgi:ribosomal protein S18 acetylase RimI-like enzyme
MKWGVRRYQNEDGSYTAAGRKRYSGEKHTLKTKTGKRIEMHRLKNKKGSENEYNYDLISGDKKVGNLFMEKQGNAINLNWIGVKKKFQGNGYAQSVLKKVISESMNKGIKELTLEVPSGSKDARHIYEKYGFVKVSDLKYSDGTDMGLTSMKRKL